MDMKTSRPELLNIKWSLTDICNLDCDFCYSLSDRNTFPGLTTEQLLGLADQINASTVQHVSLIGGEPLLRDDLGDIVFRLRPDITLSLDTNGTLIPERWDPRFSKRFLNVSVGLDGPPEVNDLSRKSSQKVIEAIRFLRSEGVAVKIPVVVTKKNYQFISRIITFLVTLEPSYIQLNRYSPNNGINQAKLLLSPREEQIALEESLKLIKEEPSLKHIIGFSRWFHPYLFTNRPRKSMPSCFCGFWKASISSHGHFVPCFVLTQERYRSEFEKKYKIPKLTEEHLNTAFHCMLFKDIRSAAVDFIPDTCFSCRFEKQCIHGCRVHAFLATGNLLGHDPNCRIEQC